MGEVLIGEIAIYFDYTAQNCPAGNKYLTPTDFHDLLGFSCSVR